MMKTLTRALKFPGISENSFPGIFEAHSRDSREFPGKYFYLNIAYFCIKQFAFLFVILNLKTFHHSQHHFLGLDCTAFYFSERIIAMHGVNISWLFSFLSETHFSEGKNQTFITSINRSIVTL